MSSNQLSYTPVKLLLKNELDKNVSHLYKHIIEGFFTPLNTNFTFCFFLDDQEEQQETQNHATYELPASSPEERSQYKPPAHGGNDLQ